MSLRDSLQIALLLAVGYILRLIVPGYGAGMKPDLMLGMLFVIILMHRNFKVTMLAGALTAIITALTTTFPGGQIPNLIDKPLTSLFVYVLVMLIVNPLEKLLGRTSFTFLGLKASLGTFLSCGIIGFLGTLFSGFVFLMAALAIVGLPAPFKVLYATVVIPTAIANTVSVMVLYPLVTLSKRVIAGSQREEEIALNSNE
ncbi:MAG: tryptophan transporter [Bacillota bacterium]